MKRSCVTCHWWAPLDGGTLGHCKGAPPTAGNGGLGIWPMTQPTWACKAWDLDELIIQRGQLDDIGGA